MHDELALVATNCAEQSVGEQPVQRVTRLLDLLWREQPAEQCDALSLKLGSGSHAHAGP